MSRSIKITLALTALLTAVGTMAPSADAQKAGPATGWVPGQPVLVSITSPDGVPLGVVYAGRIPLAADARVRLMLPGLADTGLVYTVSTTGGGDEERRADKDGAHSKPQWVVGRVHASFIQAPAAPVLGNGGSSLLSTSSSLDEYSLLPIDTGSPPHSGKIAATATDDNGTRRRDIVAPPVNDLWFGTTKGTVLAGNNGNLGVARNFVHGFTATLVGPLEGGSGGTAAALTLDDARASKKSDPPKTPRIDLAPRPIQTIPIPTQANLTGDGNIGSGGVVILIDDQGIEFESSSG